MYLIVYLLGFCVNFVQVWGGDAKLRLPEDGNWLLAFAQEAAKVLLTLVRDGQTSSSR